MNSRTANEVARDVWERVKKSQRGEFSPTTPTLFSSVDMLAELPKSLCFLGALSGIGKSLFAANMIRMQILAGYRVGFMVLEDTDCDLLLRIACAHTQTNNMAIVRKDGMGEKALSRFYNGISEISKWQNLSLAEGIVSASNVVSEARKLIQENDLQILVIDHFHRIRRTSNNDLRDYCDAAEGLQNLASQSGVTIFCTAQFNRGATNPLADGTRPKPNMSAVKGSSDLEQCARWFAILDRPEYWDIINDEPTEQQYKNHVYVRLQKVTTGGMVGSARLGIRPETSTLFKCRCADGIFCEDVAKSSDDLLSLLKSHQ